MPPPVLASIWRGDVCEAVIRGHIAVVDRAGRLVGAAGDPTVVTTLRSCVKPIQALPFARGPMDAVGATDAELALACASHSGEPEHVSTARSLLARGGVSEAALACGAQLPFDEAAARRVLAAGEEPLPVHNNCSGKHAAMLVTCAVAGWPLEGYLRRDHPCQTAVTAALSSVLDVDLGSAPWGVDGCGLPTYGVPLDALARGFARGSLEPGFQRCQDAMAAHPHLVAGTGRFDTALLAAAGSRVTAKIGGAALWAAVLRGGGAGVALKLEAGASEAIPAVAAAVLKRLGAFPDPAPADLAVHEEPLVRNWAGDAVGRIRVDTAALTDLRPGPIVL